MEPLIYRVTRRRLSAGFSLVEMIVVLAIVAIMLTLSVTTFSHVTGAVELGSTGDHILGLFVRARQLAVADNAHVEVRLYFQSAAGDEKVVQADSFGMLREIANGSFESLENHYFVPLGIRMEPSSKYSTLLGTLEQQEEGSDSTGIDKRIYTAFRFNPDGSTNLPSNSDGDTWHLTLVDAKFQNQKSQKPPSNFFTLRIDPYTGAVRVFRP